MSTDLQRDDLPGGDLPSADLPGEGFPVEPDVPPVTDAVEPLAAPHVEYERAPEEAAALPAALASAGAARSSAGVPTPPLGAEFGAENQGGWLPTLRQIGEAARFNLPAAIGPTPDWPYFLRGLHSSMREAAALIVVVSLLAGLPMLIATWASLAEAHSTLQLEHLQANLRRLALLAPNALAPGLAALLNETGQLVSGLSPVGPPQATAGLSALSQWLALPLRALTIWLAYGALVLGVAKALGSGATLPRFYAATGYAVLPLALWALAPIPVVGRWFAALAVAAALAAYVLAVSVATELDRWQAAIAVLLPAAVIALAAVLAGAVFSLVML